MGGKEILLLCPEMLLLCPEILLFYSYRLEVRGCRVVSAAVRDELLVLALRHGGSRRVAKGVD